MSSNGGRAARAAGVMLAVGATLIGVAGPAAAGIFFGAGPNFNNGAPVTVSDTNKFATVTVQNGSDGQEAGGDVLVSQITLIPSCGSTNPVDSGCADAGAADPGVFTLNGPLVGESGTACAGRTFAVSVINPTTGEALLTPNSVPVDGTNVRLTPAGTVNAICRIDFTFDVIKAPKDSQPATPGLQTRQFVSATGTSVVTGQQATSTGSGGITVNPATPTIVTSASPANASVGTPISDTATLFGGAGPFPGPAGTITFRVFGPNNPTCVGPPSFTSAPVAVAGNGTYPSPSPSYIPPFAGTYQFIAIYSGDANNLAASTLCGDAAETVLVSRNNPSVITTASAPPPTLPGQVTDTATLAGATTAPPAGGTLTFTLFGPGDPTCAGPPVFTSTPVVVNGNGSYVSPPATISSGGTYQWVATYSGDANNVAVITPCGAPNESVTVTAAPTSQPRPLLGDFNGDGQTDIAVFRPANGTWYVRGISETVWGQSGDVPVPADYAGSAASEIAVFRPSNSTWYIRGVSETVWGQPGDIPVPADYNGDGKADIAVFRPANGTWYVRGISETVWGQPGDVPVPADYAGDARADIAVFRPANGTWYVKGFSETVWGQSGDTPVPANYGGDAKADLAVFRPANGTWYVRGISETVWGQSGDVPVVGDYNGGGGADLAAWRPSNATWYVRTISETVWGVSTDIPV